MEKRNWHIDTGILGSKYILNALLENGRADVAYRMATQRDLPSWGWWIEQGATTLWEQWNGTESRNHIMFGDVVAWFYKSIGGIQPDPQSPGFEHFILQPHLFDLAFARAEYDSIRGRIVSDWKRRGDLIEWKVVVPANSRATMYLPIAEAAAVRESGKLLDKAKGVQFIRQEANRTVVALGSGSYKFTGPVAP